MDPAPARAAPPRARRLPRSAPPRAGGCAPAGAPPRGPVPPSARPACVSPPGPRPPPTPPGAWQATAARTASPPHRRRSASRRPPSPPGWRPARSPGRTARPASPASPAGSARRPRPAAPAAAPGNAGAAAGSFRPQLPSSRQLPDGRTMPSVDDRLDVEEPATQRDGKAGEDGDDLERARDGQDDQRHDADDDPADHPVAPVECTDRVVVSRRDLTRVIRAFARRARPPLAELRAPLGSAIAAQGDRGGPHAVHLPPSGTAESRTAGVRKHLSAVR